MYYSSNIITTTRQLPPNALTVGGTGAQALMMTINRDLVTGSYRRAPLAGGAAHGVLVDVRGAPAVHRTPPHPPTINAEIEYNISTLKKEGGSKISHALYFTGWP